MQTVFKAMGLLRFQRVTSRKKGAKQNPKAHHFQGQAEEEVPEKME
jgi:hypothetical protein